MRPSLVPFVQSLYRHRRRFHSHAAAPSPLQVYPAPAVGWQPPAGKQAGIVPPPFLLRNPARYLLLRWRRLHRNMCRIWLPSLRSLAWCRGALWGLDGCKQYIFPLADWSTRGLRQTARRYLHQTEVPAVAVSCRRLLADCYFFVPPAVCPADTCQFFPK